MNYPASHAQLIQHVTLLFTETTKHPPYPYQQRLIEDTTRFKIINKSRQVGISYLMACWGLLNACFQDKLVLIISPSERQSKHLMDYIREFLTVLKTHGIITHTDFTEETKTSYIFTNGGSIYSLPNSANTVRGFTADLIIIDEFAHFLHETDKDIMTAITPSISRGGELLLISTPFGDQNLFYEYWMNHPEYSKHTINYTDCPDLHINKNEYDDLTFEQEFNNQFLSDSEDSEFPFTLIHQCIQPDLDYEHLHPKKHYYAGIDIGRKHDKTAFIALEKTKDDTYVVREKIIMNNTPYQEQQHYFEHILREYVFAQCMVDETGIGSMLAENLSKNSSVNLVSFNNENKQEMLSNLKRIMQQGRLRFPNDPELINNIRAIKRKYSDTGYLKFDSGRDTEIGHADLFWALALSLYNAEHDLGGMWIG